MRQLRPFSVLLASLSDLGWHSSVISQAPVDHLGKPIPWWSYAAIRWLDSVLTHQHHVFEFGSGNSTLWLAQRVATVTSVEHDEVWFDRIRRALPENAEIMLRSSPSSEARSDANDEYILAYLQQDIEFDLVIIDGLTRNACARVVPERLREGGLILLDDADRPKYAETHQLLGELGFGRIDFFGLKPGVGHLSTTSVFSTNFLNWSVNLPPPVPSQF